MRAQSARRLTLALVVLAFLAPAMAQALPSFHVKSLDSAAVETAGKPASWIGTLWQGIVRLWSGNAVSEAGLGGGPAVPTGESNPGTGAGPGIDPDGGKGNG